MLDVTPGMTYIFPMAISSKSDDAPSDYAIEVLGFGLTPEGGTYTPIPANDDTGAFSARSFISIPSPVIHLNPGQRVAFNATLRIPPNVGDGGRYALIHIHPAAAAGQQASFATAVIVPVMLTVKDTKLAETGTITGIEVGDVVAGKPIKVMTLLRNTGNHHYYGVVNNVTVTDINGKIIASAKSDPAVRAVIPGQSVRFDTPVTNPLPVGSYFVKSDLILESGAILDNKTVKLDVKEAYIPPFSDTEIKINPDNAATLNVPEGTVSIRIPQGAVLADTNLVVKPYVLALPEMPAGVTAGRTAFTIDGVSGLLTKDATVVVKYSKADLDAAKGDASKLVLARYDRSDGRWTLVPTTVDTNVMTLTATTNRFSTWAVVSSQQAPKQTGNPNATPSPTPGPDPLLICGFVFIVLLWKSAGKNQ